MTDKIDGSKGWTIAKFHAMSMISKLNLKLGCSKCFDSSSNEKNHKSFVKKPAGRTQRIGSKFSSQMAKCDFNRIVIERSYNHIKKYTSRDHSSVIGRNVRVNISTEGYDEESDEEEEDEEDDDTVDESLVMRHVGDRMIIAPPLVIKPAEIDVLIERAQKSLDEAMAQVKAQGLWAAA